MDLSLFLILILELRICEKVKTLLLKRDLLDIRALSIFFLQIKLRTSLIIPDLADGIIVMKCTP